VFKVRKPLPYRLCELDDAIRRQRTIHESEMIGLAKVAGVNAPHLYFVDPPSSVIVMEFVEGDRLKDVVPGMPPAELENFFRLLGRDIARLHGSGIMHGDLTTANIVRKGDNLFFLDFGLSIHSDRVEDHAVDLRLIKETLSGAHSKVAQAAMGHLIEGYGDGVGAARVRQVQKQLLSIERRGRYARLG